MPGNAIYTASDRKYGDFLIDHWYRSLRENTDLTDTEVRVLDYGLSTAQGYYLAHEGAVVVPCVRDGHPAVIRFRDMARDLADHPVDQVLACDGGDLIFQGDVAPLFRQNTGAFRAVTEGLHSGFDTFLSEEFFFRDDVRLLQDVLGGRPQINAGFLLAPADRFAALCRRVETTIRRPDKFGPDQLVVNLVLHSEGFVELDTGYNYVIATAAREFVLVNGEFRFTDGTTIPVVHNAGNWSVLRPIKNFGYGPGFNDLRADVLHTLKLVHQSTSFLLWTRDSWNRLRTRAWNKTFGRNPRFHIVSTDPPSKKKL